MLDKETQSFYLHADINISVILDASPSVITPIVEISVFTWIIDNQSLKACCTICIMQRLSILIHNYM